MSSSVNDSPLPRRFSILLRDLRRAPVSAKIGMVIVAAYALIALFAPLIAPYGEYEVGSRILPLLLPHEAIVGLGGLLLRLEVPKMLCLALMLC